MTTAQIFAQFHHNLCQHGVPFIQVDIAHFLKYTFIYHIHDPADTGQIALSCPQLVVHHRFTFKDVSAPRFRLHLLVTQRT